MQQSGETADTTAAQREAKKKGSRTIAVSNVENSTIAREADGVLYTHAGPEISIASTKAFTAQMAVLFLFAAYLAQVREESPKYVLRRWIEEMLALPRKTESTLKTSDQCQRLAHPLHPRSAGIAFSHARNCSSPIVRLSHGGAERAGRGPPAESREICDVGVRRY